MLARGRVSPYEAGQLAAWDFQAEDPADKSLLATARALEEDR